MALHKMIKKFLNLSKDGVFKIFKNCFKDGAVEFLFKTRHIVVMNFKPKILGNLVTEFIPFRMGCLNCHKAIRKGMNLNSKYASISGLKFMTLLYHSKTRKKLIIPPQKRPENPLTLCPKFFQK
jgi:hypothetical protein